MEPIFIETGQSLLITIISTIAILIGLGISVWKVKAEFRDQIALLMTRTDLEKEKKTRERRHEFFKEFTDVMVEQATEMDDKLKEKNMYKFFVLGVESINLFENQGISNDLFSSFDKFFEGKIGKREDITDKNMAQEYDAGEFIGFALSKLVDELKPE